MIEIFDESNLLKDAEKLFAQTVLEEATTKLNLPCETDICLSIVGNEEIRELNREQRGLDKVTDVLSFPMLNFSYPMEKAAFERVDISAMNPETGHLFLGDIVLNWDRTNEQALEYGHSLQREFAFLILHSFLHLLGYDHESKEEEKEMFTMQEILLQEMGIGR